MGGGYGYGGGGGGYGVPPAPTQTMTVGAAAMSDPSFGRYERQDIRQATAPRQPATYGRTQSQILQGAKPFSAYKPADAYSPYMRLNTRNLESARGANAYYEWVKPLVDQQHQNRRTEQNIIGLEGVARSGYQTMESMRQRPGNMIRSAAPRVPATFMNTGQYYPGFGGSRR
jgi:hypothetical protein